MADRTAAHSTLAVTGTSLKTFVRYLAKACAPRLALYYTIVWSFFYLYVFEDLFGYYSDWLNSFRIFCLYLCFFIQVEPLRLTVQGQHVSHGAVWRNVLPTHGVAGDDGIRE